MSHRDRSIANMRCEAKRIYNQRRYINKLEKDKKELQQRLDKIEECIKNFLCTEEYINVDGKAIADNYEELLKIIGDNDE